MSPTPTSTGPRSTDSPAGAAVGGTAPTGATGATDRTTADRAGLREEAEAALVALVGRPDARLRDDQWVAIEALVADHRRALVVQRTGWGKSAVYFVATALLRARGAGPTVIVSPLLALMRNQVEAAQRAGIRAETINSANVTEWDGVHERVAAGEVDVLLVSPERLNNPGFREEVLPRLAASAGLVVVDEAHCISDWGHDFRPDYRRIRTLLADLPAGIPVLATTATANARVTADVAEQLAVTSESTDGADATPAHPERALADVLVLRGSLDRESLHLAVARLPDQASQLAWLGHRLPQVDGSGIVYCLTVAAAQQVTEYLREQGMAVRAYSGQTDPAEREAAEQDLLANRVKALVATSALGMGFDKPDLAFVVHLGAPASPISYYQQVGRAGRATDRAEVVLLPGREDTAIWDYFASMAFPPEAEVRATLAALEAGGTLSTAALETRVSLRRNRLELMLKVLDVDGAVRRVRGGWESTGRAWEYDAERYRRVAETRRAEQRAMLDYVTTDDCRMAYLRRALDDPDLTDGWRCGRCDVCGGTSAGEAPDDAEVAAARERLAVPGVEVEPRRQWPTGMSGLGIDLSGRIAVDERPETGRAVARLDGIGWGGLLRDLFAPAPAGSEDDGSGPGSGGSGPGAGGEPDGAAGGGAARDGGLPVALRRPVLEVLDAWHPDPAPAGVVLVESASRPELVRHLAEGLAHRLGVPVVGSVGPVLGVPAGRHDVNSAQRLAGVARRLELHLSDAAAAGLPGRAVLLVDDRTDSGWTLTVAARLLRRAGASAVHPFVLAVG
ncbi:RecQ family ATP-dependent DNA helicase [Cellulomonas sp. ATA003]|uniref:RecQ family ATP-dependent DNA helicase n=1 Tax=Cellulomonas sp. ATA003 TaxID=3073064 RepID=UPI0028739670|nr:RecQ family ATP-dependent DNA helicase [Cellulomonas sp. ATA003]WNB84834.1 RecQ family ATP-dependent DNA helicase [Cellulomonas sp. ATA003]